MSKTINITVTADSPEDGALVVANLMHMFRTLGRQPKLVTPDDALIIRVGADAWQAANQLAELVKEALPNETRVPAEVVIVQQAPESTPLKAA